MHQRHRSRHDRRARRGARRRGAPRACGSSTASRSPRSKRDRDVHVLGYFFDPGDRAAASAFLHGAARRSAPAGARDRPSGCAALGVPDRRRRDPRRCARVIAGRSVGRPHVADALVAGRLRRRRRRGVRSPARRRPAGVRAAPRRDRRRKSSAIIAAAGGIASLAHPGLDAASTTDLRRSPRPASTALEVRHTRSRRRDRGALPRAGRSARARGVGGSDFHGDSATAPPATRARRRRPSRHSRRCRGAATPSDAR